LYGGGVCGHRKKFPKRYYPDRRGKLDSCSEGKYIEIDSKRKSKESELLQRVVCQEKTGNLA
jgi:hypothetical protein